MKRNIYEWSVLVFCMSIISLVSVCLDIRVQDNKQMRFRDSMRNDKIDVHEQVVYDECIFDGRPFGCDQTEVEQVDFFETEQHRCITVLQDKSGKKFIVKQEMRDALVWHLGIAGDKLGALVAQSVAILANRVEIIPSYCIFPGKRNKYFPATLHEFVPGVQVTFLLEKYAHLQKSIRQCMKKNMSQKDWGLTEEVIRNMSVHKDLCRMVALDTFIANADRNDKNYFYDEVSNHFFAIDFESSFRKNLACHACVNIESLINNTYNFVSIRILRGLEEYQKVLKQLIELYTAESLYEQLEQCVVEGGIISRALKTAVEKKLEVYKRTMKDNYESCKQLVVLIDQLMLKYKYT